jgi:hypothetical protein
VTDSGSAHPSLPVLVDTRRYPREFSLSLVCSLLLHVAAATLFLQEVRFPSDVIPDVFVEPDWTPSAEIPKPAGGGAPTALRRPAATGASRLRTADIAKPRDSKPGESKVTEEAAAKEPTVMAKTVAPTPAPTPAPVPVEATAPRVVPEPSAPSAPETAAAPESTAPVTAVPAVPNVVASPEPRPEALAARKIEADSPAPRPAPERAPEPPPAATAERGRPQAPSVQPGVTETVAKPTAPPSEWRAAQPLVPVAPLAPATSNAPGSTPSTEGVAPPPTLGIPAPAPPEPAVASVAPPPPTPSPLDWEVPKAEERVATSVGRAREGLERLTGAGTSASATTSVTGAVAPQMAPEGRVSGSARESERPKSPEASSIQPFTGRGTGPFGGPGQPGKSDAPGGATGGTGTTPPPRNEDRTAGAAGAGDRAVASAPKRSDDVRGGAPQTGVPLPQVGAGGTAAGTGGATAAAGGATSGAGGTAGNATADAGGTGAGGSTGGGSTAGPSRADAGGGGGGTGPAVGPGQGAGAGAGAGEQGGGSRQPGRVVIVSPQNGHRLSEDDAPIVIVRGRVDDPEISSVWLTANSRRVQVRVRDGHFEYPLVVIDRSTTISAEVPSSAIRRSELVTVHAAPGVPATAVVILDWGETKPAGEVGMAATWRARADRLDSQEGKVFVRPAPLPDDIPATAFYVRNMQSGVYTFVLGYRGLDAGTRVVPKFYLTTPGIPTARETKGVTLAGSGKSNTIRVMLPQGVLWDQDDWFTGRSESSESIIKFRDDGTSWIERKE